MDYDARHPHERRRMWAGMPLWAWVAFGIVLLFIVGAILWGTTSEEADDIDIASGPEMIQGDAEATAPGSIGAVTSSPAEFDGQTVTLVGEVAEFTDEGFLLEETGAVEGDDLRVFSDEAIAFQQGAEVQVNGRVQIVDEATYDEFGSGFFDDLAFEDVEGDAVIRAETVVAAEEAGA